MIEQTLYKIEIPFIFFMDEQQRMVDNLYLINCNTGLLLRDLKICDNETPRFIINFEALETESLYDKLVPKMSTVVSVRGQDIQLSTLNHLFSNPNKTVELMLENISMEYGPDQQMICTLFVKLEWNTKVSKFLWKIDIIDISPVFNINISDYPKIEGYGPKFKSFNSMIEFLRQEKLYD